MPENKLTQYAKERDEMLLKGSIEELRKFVLEHENCFSLMFVDAIAKASDEVLEITLHKMIVNAINLPLVYRVKSAGWLCERGFRLDIGGGVKGG